MISHGIVFLAGAGPGDPDLLTVGAKRALETCGVVVYDRLVDPAIVALAPPEALRIYVGKQADRHTMKQDEINAVLAEHGVAGKRVVRLKGGDPFVFGRGGEEAEYLRDRNIPFVVIPGITSAIAAPAYAGIPVTHRDAASSFAVITGHERGDRAESRTRTAGDAEQRRDWNKIAHAADTLVFLMGVESLDDIAANLIANGRAPETPVATIQWGTWADQRTVVATLATIVDAVRDAGITAPAVTVIGEVVAWRDKLRWWDNRPLFGKTVVVTRAREQASELSQQLRDMGATVLEFPTIRIAPPQDDYAALDAEILRLPAYDWVIFTSANGVRHFFERLRRAGKDARAFASVKVAAMGDGTAAKLNEFGITADFVPTRAVSEAFLEEFLSVAPRGAILLPAASAGRDVLADGLTATHHTVTVAPAYETVPDAGDAEDLYVRIHNGHIDAVLFASSSSVRHFYEATANLDVPNTVLLTDITLAAIGPVTADTVRELYREPDVIAVEHTIAGLVAALCDYYKEKE